MSALPFRHYASRFSRPLLWVMLGSALLLAQPLTWRVQLPPQFWVRQFSLLVLWVALFYLNAQLAVPRLLFRGRTGWFIGLLAAALVVVMVLNVLIENSLNLPALMHKAFHPEGGPVRRRSAGWFDMGTLLISMLVLGISTSVAVVRKWQHDAQLRRELEQQQTAAELSFLKAQINPHFFFNTLNNIYALTVVNGELARQALHTLSRMMRYVLYETQASTTLLSQEAAFVQDYIALMQLRLTDKVTVTFECPTPPQLRDVPIAPMLLLPFIENAFKHGVSALQLSQIYIGLHQHAGTLTLEVRNTVFPDKRPAAEEAGSGIGLANTRRRLDLLYPHRYQLSVEEGTAATPEFRVRLVLEVGPDEARSATAARAAPTPALHH